MFGWDMNAKNTFKRVEQWWDGLPTKGPPIVRCRSSETKKKRKYFISSEKDFTEKHICFFHSDVIEVVFLAVIGKSDFQVANRNRKKPSCY